MTSNTASNATSNWVTHLTEVAGSSVGLPANPAMTFPYELDDFQKHAVMSIEKGEHVLVSVPTGAGKTSVCLYAIADSLNKAKKVIYTSPIKSLSNQKFKEFKEKLEPIYGLGTVGILTGDIKFNPEARCLIMTTEILRNLLYKQGETKKQCDEATASTPTSQSMIALDLNEIGCVVFDEVHYINDRDRGKVWEETIVMLPSRILLVMLSATIDKPEKFASWIGDLKQHRVNLITSSFRPVPLSHFIFAFNPDTRSDGSGANDPRKTGKLIKIMNEHNKYIDEGYSEAHGQYRERYLDPVTRKPKHIKGKSTQQANIQLNKMELSANCLNQFFKFLQAKNLLPALIFVLSRKNCESYASNVNISLVNPEESAEIAKIFNFNMHPYVKQYEKLRQFTVIKELLQKGIGIHHSGLVPILKEIVEILFATGLIKVLFCTETFAVGVNMPTKTVVFTELEKYDGYYGRKRLLKTDEYLQMAGRAGRRGLDVVGTVIHFPLRELPDRTELKLLMTGLTPEICSKFSLNYQFILKVIESDNHNLMDFVNSSLLNREQTAYLASRERELETVRSAPSTTTEPSKEILEYCKIQELLTSGFTFKPKQRKEIETQLRGLSNNNDPKFLEEYQNYINQVRDNTEEQKLENEVRYLQEKNFKDTETVLKFLGELKYLKLPTEMEKNFKNLDKSILQLKGLLGAQISECNEILLTELITSGVISHSLSIAELAGVLAIFIDERAGNDEPIHPKSLDISPALRECVEKAQRLANDLERREHEYGIDEILLTDWTVATDFVQATYYWAQGKNIAEIYQVTDVYEGNFIRGILKISHMAESLVTLAEIMQNQELAKLAETLSKSLIRDEVTVNSLYVK